MTHAEVDPLDTYQLDSWQRDEARIRGFPEAEWRQKYIELVRAGILPYPPIAHRVWPSC